MGKIRITLLVPRQPQEHNRYALEITYPFQLIPDEILLTEARLFDRHGKRFSEEETWGAYHPEEWRAATPQEQREYLQELGCPKPWFRTLHGVVRSVYSYLDSGDQETNNGQVWESLDDEWKEEEKLRNHFLKDEEEWKERVKAELLRRFERWGEG